MKTDIKEQSQDIEKKEIVALKKYEDAHKPVGPVISPTPSPPTGFHPVPIGVGPVIIHPPTPHAPSVQSCKINE